ncbi:MAG: endolytic transglycosylase MltG [Micavibrio sp.]
MKKFILFFLSLAVAIAALCAVWLFLQIRSAQSPGPLAAETIMLIERGRGVAAIAQKLEDTDIIESAFIFKLLTRIDGDRRPLKAGEYQFTAHIKMEEVLEKLRAGDVYDRKVTFPEGMTSWQVVEILNALPDLSGEIDSVPAEGTLLPQTYHYINGDDRAVIIARMQDGLQKALDELWAGRAEDLPVKTPEEALTLASIVEKETGVADERRRVAGVFINRLRRSMPLQSDPTVIYGITQGRIQNEGQGPLGRRLLTKDLRAQNPYNTYTNPGLPPGPIANPGRASIEAVLNPEIHDYIYFVADGTGGHVFARTLAEHNRNVANWRKIRRGQQ